MKQIALNFLGKMVRAQCGNLKIFLPRFFHKNFGKVTFLLKSYIYCKLIAWKCLKWGKTEITTLYRVNFWKFHKVCKRFHEKYVSIRIQSILPGHSAVWENENFGLAKEIFRQIKSLVISFVKTLLSRNLCQKCVRLNYCNFHTVQEEVRTISNLKAK